MKKIRLTGGLYALVDDQDFEKLSRYRWRVNAQGYAVRREYTRISKGVRHGKDIRMHRQIMDEPEGLEVDHKNGNGLDNQRPNLRVATHRQNMFNRRKQSNNKSGFIGVSWSKQNKKWYACIGLPNRKTKCIGFFDDVIEAAKAYNQVALELRGRFARLNPL